VGPELAGGFPFELFGPDAKIIPGKHVVSPNITMHPQTGIMAGWSQEVFVERFKTGRVIEGSPMPWGPFSRMSEMELIVIYKYLSSVDPIERKIPVGIQDGDPAM
jgi:hypothetical protein